MRAAKRAASLSASASFSGIFAATASCSVRCVAVSVSCRSWFISTEAKYDLSISLISVLLRRAITAAKTKMTRNPSPASTGSTAILFLKLIVLNMASPSLPAHRAHAIEVGAGGHIADGPRIPAHEGQHVVIRFLHHWRHVPPGDDLLLPVRLHRLDPAAEHHARELLPGRGARQLVDDDDRRAAGTPARDPFHEDVSNLVAGHGGAVRGIDDHHERLRGWGARCRQQQDSDQNGRDSRM